MAEIATTRASAPQSETEELRGFLPCSQGAVDILENLAYAVNVVQFSIFMGHWRCRKKETLREKGKIYFGVPVWVEPYSNQSINITS